MGTFKTQMLWDSIRRSDLTATIGLLESGNINLEERDENGQTFLMLACEFGEINIVRELLEAHVDPNAVDTDNWSALMYSAKEGHLEILIELLEKGADVDHRDMCGWSALMWASYKGKDLIVAELLERGANPNIKAELNMTCLAWASGRGHTETVKLLLQKGAKVNAPDKYGTTPLIWSSRKGYLEIVEALLNEGANVDAVGMNSWTALLVSAKGGFSEVINQLLEYDPNVNAVDKDGFTALTISAKEGYVEIAHDLLNKGAYVNLADRAGDTILIHAVKGGHTEVVRALINKYADVDVEGSEGKTALYWAVEKGHPEIVQLLLQSEPDLEIYNKDEDTALLRAVRNRNELCVRLLLDKGAKVSAVDKRGDTGLHISLRARSKRITELLLRNPRNSRLLYRPNKAGETPYNIDAYHQKGILTHIFGHRNLNANDGENLLGYDIYSSALADILSEPSLNTPITVGLYAKWGSGKSFLMSKLQKEMKSFTRANRDEHFTFCWTLFIILLLLNNIVGLTLAVAYKWEVGLGVGFGLFPVEYAFLGFVYLFTHRYNVRFAMRISLLLGRKLLVLTLLLEVLFFNPKHRSSSSYNEPAVRFLFSKSTKLTSVGGEKALAAMIGTLADTLEMEYGFIVARLFRVFKPQADKPYSGRFKSLCCIPYFVIVYLVFLSIEVGVYILVWYRTFQPNPDAVPVTAPQFQNTSTTAMPTTTVHYHPLEQNTAIYAVLITVGCIVGFAIVSNIYTWGQAVLALLMSQRRRILQAADQIDRIRMDGLMQRLKAEVDLMSKFVTCMDKFTQNQTRLVVIVDGLDSCEQDKVLQVLDIIKALFADEESPFITILAVDPHIIIKGIESNINKTFQDSNVNGFDYLRNVVHLPFYLQSQGMAINKQDLTRSNSAFEVGSHSSESPNKSQKTFQHQESILSNSSINEVRRKSRRNRQDSTTPLVHSSFDLTNTLTKTDYFSDVNPRSLRRLKNIVAVTARLLRAYNIEFNWHRLASWINIIEQWPYRVSWIICYFEENEITDNNTSLLDIYRKIADKIPTSKEVEPLLEIDRNVRKMKAFLGSGSSNNIVLNLGDLKKFLPCTINLDPYLRKLIRELQKSTDVLRSDFPMGPMFPGSPSSGAGGGGQAGNKMNGRVSDIIPPRRVGSFRSTLFPGHSQMPMDQSMLHPQMANYGMMQMFPQGFGNIPFIPGGFPENQTVSRRHDPSTLIQDYHDERLSQMSVDDVCDLLSKLKGINPSMIQQYRTLIVDNNISGLVLSGCDIEELGKVMGMKFGDWQLFKSALSALRGREADMSSNCNVPMEERAYTHKTEVDRTIETVSPSSSTTSQVTASRSTSNYDSQKKGRGSENRIRRLSSESLGSFRDTKKFETISEHEENDDLFVEETRGINRSDSALQQVVFESGLLHKAIISFTEDDEDEDEEEFENVEELDEPKAQKIPAKSGKVKRPVKFSLDFQDSSFENEDDDENVDDRDTDRQPLLERSPLLQKSKQTMSGASSADRQEDCDKQGLKASTQTRTPLLKDVSQFSHVSEESRMDETERLYIVDEVKGHLDSQPSAEESLKEHMRMTSSKGKEKEAGSPLQMVTFSSDLKLGEDIADV